MRSRLRFLIGFFIGTKQFTQPGARGLCPAFPARTQVSKFDLEIGTEISTLRIGDLLGILFAAFACQARVVEKAQATGMQVDAFVHTAKRLSGNG